MKNYTAVIIDDEPKLQKVLESKLNAHCPHIKIVGLAKSARTAYQTIIKEKPDLIFLDISMPEESGFDLLEYFDSFSFEIIFVTGYSEYAIDALRLSAVDYILKPIRNKLLVEAVDKAIIKIEERKDIERYKILKNNLDVSDIAKSKIAIPGIKKYSFIEVAQIIRCEGWKNYTKIHLQSGETLISSYTLGVVKDLLVNFNFYSIHKSHFINVNEIVSYVKEGILVLSDGSQLPVSRRNRKDFVDNVIKQNSILTQS